jgi:iron(III) transport system permease protein
LSQPIAAPGAQRALAARWAAMRGSNWVALTIAWPALAMIVILSLFIFYMTFVPDLPFEPGYTLDHWKNIGAGDYLLTRVLPNTLIVGFGTVVISFLFAAPLAWLLNRTNMPLRSLFMTLISVIIIIPGFVTAMAWIMLLQGKIGLLNQLLMQIFNLSSPPFNISSAWGMAWILGLMLVPAQFFLMAGPLRSLDPSLEDAARVSGVRNRNTIIGISLPLIWPAALSGMIYTFMTALSIFDVPAMLGGAGGQVPVLATELFYAVQPLSANQGTVDYGAAGVYGVLIAIPSLAALYMYLRTIDKSHRYIVVSGKGYRPKDIDLGPFKWLAVAFVVLYLALAVGLPILVLLWSSVLPRLQMPSADALEQVSLANYGDIEALVGGTEIIWHTVALVLITTVFVILISFMTSWLVVRARVRARKLIDSIAMLPHAIPGIGFAFALVIIGVMVSAAAPWVPLAGTLFILILANTLSRLAYGTRITNAALLQIGPELEEAALVCGASKLSVMTRIFMPMVRPSLVFGAIWAALLTFREVSMALMLMSTDNQVLPARIWVLWRQGELVGAAATSTVMIAVMGVLVFLAFWLAERRPVDRLSGNTNLM